MKIHFLILCTFFIYHLGVGQTSILVQNDEDLLHRQLHEIRGYFNQKVNQSANINVDYDYEIININDYWTRYDTTTHLDTFCIFKVQYDSTIKIKYEIHFDTPDHFRRSDSIVISLTNPKDCEAVKNNYIRRFKMVKLNDGYFTSTTWDIKSYKTGQEKKIGVVRIRVIPDSLKLIVDYKWHSRTEWSKFKKELRKLTSAKTP